ncbi:polysaccharide deacetylase family protein [Polluticoccus soli]|uniref:polysaccharide deacetylase family protein n=1 Tax=Polluticoccus soli TaxID=3034150 RepID=UPI0023E34BB4|nr:polysaccharide deacetylase family protein [Flavipsychrobacter sp. JY13-12]
MLSRLIKYFILVLAGIVISLYFVSRSRTFQFFGNIISSVQTDKKIVALTFDDGPTKYTAEVLGILSQYNIKATFFLTGSEMTQHPELVKQITMAGHSIGNHSYSHQRMLLKSSSFLEEEVRSTDSIIHALGYTRPIYFRPPYCKKLFYLPYYLSKTGRTTVTWNIEPDSKPDIANNPRLIEEYVMTRIKPGAIILLHAMYENRTSAREALPGIIRGLKHRGYSFVTIDELLVNKQ